MEPSKHTTPSRASEMNGRITIRIPFLPEIDAMAEKAVRTRSDYIRMVLREHVKAVKAKRKTKKAA
jgi:metal-responsive CopG/Arc/MetJ family transcriptional regulator